jgi:hypothetical protein
VGLPKSVRFDDELERKVAKYLKKNKIKFPHLIKLAVEKFISEPQTIKLVPANTNTFLRDAKVAYSEHENALNKLK